MQLKRFDGGLSLREDSSLINETEALIYNNIDNDKLTLSSLTSYTQLAISVSGFFYKFKDVWLSSDLQRSYAEYNNKLYITEANKEPKLYSNSEYKNLGIVAPEQACTLAQISASSQFTKLKDVSSYGNAARDLYISDDGYSLFVLDETNDAVDQYDLGTAWDISTAVYSKTKVISSQETNAMGLTFKPNGTKFYIIGNNRYVYEYTMSVAWDVSTATYTTSLNTTAQNTTPQGLSFSSDGTKLYILDSTGGYVRQYNLGTAYTLSSATFSGNAAAVGFFTGDSALTGLHFNATGTRMYVVGYSNDKVYECTLGTTWDISTAVYYGQIADISIESTESTGVFFSSDMLRLYVTTEPTGGKIVQYDVKRISSAESVLQYVYTYYNSVDDIESAPSPVTDELVCKEVRAVTVSNLVPSADPQVDKIRIYRIGDNATSFTRVAEIDSTLTSYVDNTPTTDLEELLESQDYYPAPSTGQYIVEANGIMFCAEGTKLRFSVQGKPTAWPESYYILFEKDITGLLPITDGLLVFMQDRTNIILGSSVSDFAKRKLSTEQGCINHYAAKYAQNVPIWQSLNGFCAYFNGSIKVLTREKLGLTSYDVINTAVWDDTYFALLTDGTLLCIDFKYDKLRYKTISYDEPIVNLLATEGKLYGSNSQYLLELFNGAPLEFHYKSPEFTDDSFTELKTYNNIYVRSEGEFSFKVYIDREMVKEYTLEGNTTHDIKVPQEKQKGYSIQFEITGVGTVYEIEYKVMGRQNGR